MIDDSIVVAKLDEFLTEDVGFGDITTEALISEDVTAKAAVICKERAVVAGLREASHIYEKLGCTVDPLVGEGSEVRAGSRIMEVNGPARAILKAERVALNILARMSGVATMTRRFVERAHRVEPRIKIACTRKTLPGFRSLDKRAVEVGGGDTHRFRLDDCVLIKDNHLSIVGPVREAVHRVKGRVSFAKKVEVEVSSMEQALEAAECGADIIMLDNMEPGLVKGTLEELKKRGLRDNVIVEASGNITLENIDRYARTGVDIISAGALTHSARTIDMSLEILSFKPLKKRGGQQNH